jgi:FkbM family methyltransferase
MMLKKTVRGLINRFGYDIRPLTHTSSKLRTTLSESYSLICGLGFRPRTVIDVGVAEGNMELYSAFPDAYFLLIEPLKEFESDLISVLKRYKGSYVLAAAGSSSRQVTFNVHGHHLYGSSLYKESMGAEADGYEVTLPMIRIDDILKSRQLGGPYLMKVAVQGAELEALEGAQQALMDTEVVVLSAYLFEFMRGAPQLSEVVSYMKNRGFVAFDVISRWNRPLDNALGLLEIVFVKDDGMFRRDHSYSTIEQIKLL